MAGLLQVVLFGFIVVSPGVPSLPWGEPFGIAVALTAAAASVAFRYFRGRPQEILLFAVVLICMGITGRLDSMPTSLLLAGATVAAITQLATQRPLLYGLVAGLFIGGILVNALDIGPFFGDVELIFSGEPYSPSGFARMSSLLAAVVFLTGIQNVVKRELRNQQLRADAAEAARDQAAANERARIARELHDVVSHHVTAMTLQAEAAVATGDRGALESLATSGREASAELRRMLGVLRRPTHGGAEGPPDPQPRLADVDALATRLSGGFEVNVERTGEPRTLPAGVELCAYRVIQEALTNVAKHSDASRADVTVGYSPRRLTLEIVDDGEPVTREATTSGQGLIGMRERVALLDGTLEAGFRDGQQGYRVFASVPL